MFPKTQAQAKKVNTIYQKRNADFNASFELNSLNRLWILKIIAIFF